MTRVTKSQQKFDQDSRVAVSVSDDDNFAVTVSTGTVTLVL